MEPLAHITEVKMEIFLWMNIISRFGIPKNMITGHGTQFNCKNFKLFCEMYGIQKLFLLRYAPNPMNLFEAINKSIKRDLQTRLREHKGSWVDELARVMSAYRITKHSFTG